MPRYAMYLVGSTEEKIIESGEKTKISFKKLRI
jgi:hypothetical protein